MISRRRVLAGDLIQDSMGRRVIVLGEIEAWTADENRFHVRYGDGSEGLVAPERAKLVREAEPPPGKTNTTRQRGPTPETGRPSLVLDEPDSTVGYAKSKEYRETFLKKNPHLGREVVVHHAVPQHVLVKYPNLFTPNEIHSLENLRRIPKELDSTLHHRDIRGEWNRFFRENPTTTRSKIFRKVREIAAMYGHQFVPPVRGGK
ncbi:hypothetical protein [Fimbriimonas ginsengisoli]|uniref:hypothetical protein n=1 Tax=Fimbriimonas ginsengisoli TaxID=1005039 RepID=UPI001186214C|nr:hypothetical protein [Fimbriimonas ginsengisoli]